MGTVRPGRLMEAAQPLEAERPMGAIRPVEPGGHKPVGLKRRRPTRQWGPNRLKAPPHGNVVVGLGLGEISEGEGVEVDWPPRIELGEMYDGGDEREPQRDDGGEHVGGFSSPIGVGYRGRGANFYQGGVGNVGGELDEELGNGREQNEFPPPLEPPHRNVGLGWRRGPMHVPNGPRSLPRRLPRMAEILLGERSMVWMDIDDVPHEKEGWIILNLPGNWEQIERGEVNGIAPTYWRAQYNFWQRQWDDHPGQVQFEWGRIKIRWEWYKIVGLRGGAELWKSYEPHYPWSFGYRDPRRMSWRPGKFLWHGPHGVRGMDSPPPQDMGIMARGMGRQRFPRAHVRGSGRVNREILRPLGGRNGGMARGGNDPSIGGKGVVNRGVARWGILGERDVVEGEENLGGTWCELVD